MKTNGKIKGITGAAPLMAWSPSSHVINIPANEAEYNELVAVLDYLLDTSDPDEQSPASALVDMIGSLIESYENIHLPDIFSTPKPRTVRRRAPAIRRFRTA